MILSKTLLYSNRFFTGSKWLVKMRWFALGGIFLSLLAAYYLLEFDIQYRSMIICAGLLAIANTCYFIYTRKNKNKERSITLINIQIIVDLLLLTFCLHFSGGVENPFIIFYIFHIIFAGNYLKKINAYLITNLVLFFTAVLCGLEYFKIIPHYAIEMFSNGELYLNKSYIVTSGAIFILTSYFVTYMVISTSHKIKKQELELLNKNRELEKKDQIKNEYVFRLNHDMKGHVNSIVGLLDVAVNDPSQTEFVKKALNRTNKLSEFIEELLKLTRMRLTSKVNKEKIEVCKWLKSIVEEYENEAKSKKQNFLINCQFTNKYIFGNVLSLKEVLQNLISNALKYTPEEGLISISVTHKSKTIIIEIKDTGIGIPESEIPLILNEFYRASNAKQSEIQGTGIGMAIVTQILMEHSGTIDIHSELNKGTTLTISLPEYIVD